MGRLCVSVIEARNVQVDEAFPCNFYVRVRVGLSQAKTDITNGSTGTPKFLKDLRLDVGDPGVDMLQVELLRQVSSGDLVVGKEHIRISSILDKGTLVCWLPLLSMTGECTAELCIVLRYLQADANRPMSPSYAIATRDAKQRALADTAPAGMLDSFGKPKTSINRNLFTDSQQTISSHNASTPTKHSADHQGGISAAWPGNGNSGLLLTHQSSASPAHSLKTELKSQLKAQMRQQQQQQRSLQRQQRRGLPGLQTVKNLIAMMKRLPSAIAKAGNQTQVPVHAAVACGAFIGVMLYALKHKTQPTQEVEDEGALCAVGTCFHQHAYDKYRKKYSSRF